MLFTPTKGRATALAINTHISKYTRITARHTNAPLADGMQCDAMYTHETRICIWGMPVTLLENMKTSFLINSRGDRESGIWHGRSSHDRHSWLLYSGKKFCQLFTEICLMLWALVRLTRSVTKGRGEKLAGLSRRLCWSLVAQIYPNTTAASDKKASLGCPGHQAVLRCVGSNQCFDCESVEHVLVLAGVCQCAGLRPLWGVLLVAPPPAWYPA